MLLARVTSLAVLATFGLAACRSSANIGDQGADISQETASAVTLRYVRTFPIDAADLQLTRYADLLELSNDTNRVLEYTVLSGDRVWVDTEVFDAQRGWILTGLGLTCTFGARQCQLQPGEAAVIREWSWLRETRVSVRLRESSGEEWYDDATLPSQQWFTVTSMPFDSSLAAPDAMPPALILSQGAGGDE